MSQDLSLIWALTEWVTPQGAWTWHRSSGPHRRAVCPAAPPAHPLSNDQHRRNSGWPSCPNQLARIHTRSSHLAPVPTPRQQTGLGCRTQGQNLALDLPFNAQIKYVATMPSCPPDLFTCLSAPTPPPSAVHPGAREFPVAHQRVVFVKGSHLIPTLIANLQAMLMMKNNWVDKKSTILSHQHLRY